MSFFADKIDERYQKNSESFNDQFFKNCICYAILFKTTDKIVKKAEWYISETYTKPGVVAYTIAKLIELIPQGYCLDYNLIWRKQELYSSLNAELERLSHAMFNFVQKLGGNGMEHFKKEETWNKIKSVRFQLSKEFIGDLINAELIEAQSKSEIKENKLSKKLNIETAIVMAGEEYWERLISEGLIRQLLTPTEIDLLRLAARIQKTGKMLSPKQCQWVWKIREKLEKAGVLVD